MIEHTILTGGVEWYRLTKWGILVPRLQDFFLTKFKIAEFSESQYQLVYSSISLSALLPWFVQRRLRR